MKKFLRLCSRNKNYPSSRANWVNSRKDFVRIMRKEMQRRNLISEYATYAIPLIHDASSANYCEQHAQQFQIEHNTHCANLAFCLNLEMRLAGIKFDYDFSTFTVHRRYGYDHNTMESFVTNYCYGAMIPPCWTRREYFYTDFVSTPLTVYYGIIDAKISIPKLYEDQCFVHVITSSYLDAEYAAAWELLLHGLLDIKQLTVVLIGLEFKSESSCFDLCYKCNDHKRSLKLEFSPMLYHEYINKP
ncbi:hypothetical protein EAI_01799 [Harpegnathos saltator]|uniref:Mitochondrial splicing suppressor 51-like C-terminal domain-containing protein n=1 Tax=Harpegnathos saltator TaxID=610380 RepID=E2BBU5_HARSA|nr:hypothetical protein EAI_01799 [Harpegnathos saltator]